MIALNERQLEAVDFMDGCCVVHAVPGSGKTTAVVYRIINLIKKYGVPPETILGLTFTRSAAQAMKERLAAVLGKRASKATLSTIHGFCFHFLKKEGRKFDLITGKDQVFFMKKVLKKMKIKDVLPGMALRDISLAKSNAIDVEEFLYLYQGDPFMMQMGEVYRAYELEKEDGLLLDLDDLLVMTYRLLRENAGVKDKYQHT